MIRITAAYAVPVINIATVTVDSTGKAAVDISSVSNGSTVGGMQNDILFNNTVLTLSTTNCRINQTIGTTPNGNDCSNEDPITDPCKTLSKDLKPCVPTGTPPTLPPGCPTNDPTISRFRGIVAATAVPNANPIPDGVLYTCTFTVADSTKLPQTLTNSSIIVSDPGNPPTPPKQLCAPAAPATCGGTNGAVEGQVHGVIFAIGNATEPRGAAAPVTISLSGGNNAVATAGIDVLFDTNVLSIAPSDCTIAAALASSHVLATTVPATGRVRLGIFDVMPPVDAFPDGDLATCNFHVLDTAPFGISVLTANLIQAADANVPPMVLPLGPADDGSVTVTTSLDVPAVNVGSAVPDSNNKAPINVSLVSNGATVGGLQNDILFDNTVLSLTAADCKINPAIGTTVGGLDCADDPTIGPCKTLSKDLKACGTSPQPVGCPANAPATVSRFRGIVAATAVPNANPIPDGVLFTCTFTVKDATKLPQTLTNSNIIVSDPGNPPRIPLLLCAPGARPCGGTNGQVWPFPRGITANIGSGCPDATGRASIDVTLASKGTSVGGVQNDILFDNTTLTLTVANCKINPALSEFPQGPAGPDCANDTTIGPCKTLSKDLKACGTSPQPVGCPANAPATVSRFRGIVAATAVPNANPIPDGVLYTCTFSVADATKLPATLTDSNIIVSDPGNPPTPPKQLCAPGTTSCEGTNGQIGGGCPTNTSVPTNTATQTLALRLSPTPTPTATRTPPGIVLRLGDAAMPPGDSRVPIPIFLTNPMGIRAVQFDVKQVPTPQVGLDPTPACGRLTGCA